MKHAAVAVGVAAGLVTGVVVVRRRLRLPPVWIGLHLEDGMLIPVPAGAPEAPELRALAGDVIRALRPAPGSEGDT